MFKVTVSGPIIIPADRLATLLALVGGALVEAYDGAGAPPTPATATNESQAATNEAAPKPRGRKPKEEPKEEPAPAPTQEPGAPPAGNHNRHNLLGGGEAVDRDALLEQFTALVDTDYDKALEALTSFNVQRFSELTDAQLPEFAKAIS